MPPSILTYHKIGRQFELGITSVTRRRFACHLDLMQSRGMELVTATRAASEADRAGVGLTFDDGYQSVYTEAFPEMVARRAAGTVFVVVGAIGGCNDWDVRLSLRPFRHLSWPEIDELARYGFELGSHTLSHRDLTRLSSGDLDVELRKSRQILEDYVGVEVRAVAYPFGKADKRVIDAALGAGYRFGFVSVPRAEAGGAGTGSSLSPGETERSGPQSAGGRVEEAGDTGRMTIGRMSVYAADGGGSLRRKLGLSPGRGFEVLKNRLIARLSQGTTMVKRK